MSAPNDAISVIFFDIGKVILPFDIRIATKAFEKECRVSSEEIVHRIFGNSLDLDFEGGKISPEEFYHEVKKRVGLNVSYNHFASLWNNIFSENKKVSELVRQLKRTYPMAIISNTNILHFEFIYKNFPIIREIGQFILSYQVGVRKPDPEIYQMALARFRVPPQRALYVDDREDFVLVARRLGFFGIHFRGEEPFEKELLALGLLAG